MTSPPAWTLPRVNEFHIRTYYALQVMYKGCEACIHPLGALGGQKKPLCLVSPLRLQLTSATCPRFSSRICSSFPPSRTIQRLREAWRSDLFCQLINMKSGSSAITAYKKSRLHALALAQRYRPPLSSLFACRCPGHRKMQNQSKRGGL